MERIIYQVINGNGSPIGLYSVPAKGDNNIRMTDNEFKKEFNKFEEQYEFDENNTIGAVREFVEEILIQ